VRRTNGGQARSWNLLWVAPLVLAACARAPAYEGSLTFKRDGKVVKTLPLRDLAQLPGAAEIETTDPYYKGQKRFRAFPIVPALLAGYGGSAAALREGAYVLVAQDGYRVPVDAARLLDDGAYVAVDDVDVPGFAPIGPRKVSPLPAYLIWIGEGRTNLETHPRPWQLTSIERVPEETLYPHTRPKDAPEGSAALQGFRLFRERCIRCHAINREGGSVGPELNVPQSIVAYRPEPQIRAYIKDPLTFRYGAMPANPDLSDADLDGLIAYFRAMSAQPYDPATKKTP
jgi:mono/diheme cytochrome c family protein